MKWLQLNFLVALAGLLGSLYFSEILKFPPCALCWYQRICLYPLAWIFAVGLWSEDRNYKKYAFIFVFAGLLISAYHNLLYYGFIDEGFSPCTKDLSCTSRQLELFGFLTIPLLSFISFLLVTLFLILDKKDKRSFL